MRRIAAPDPLRLGFMALAVAFTLSWASPAHTISSRTLFTPTGAAAGDQLGFSVASAGDVNGDGFPDLIAGAIGNDTGGASAGRAYVYYGGPAADATADLTLTGAAATDQFGFSVASAGDVNGDGYDDVIVGAAFNDAGGSNSGRAYVFFGGVSADATADLILTGAAANDLFGQSVASAGDVNGDGYGDLIVGALANGAGGATAGRAYVYYGGPAVDATADLTLTGAAAGDRLGSSAASAGDVNGDGYADLIVGAPLNDGGAVDAGRAYVYYGGPSADANADLTLTGATASDFFGSSVASAGDINGDGFADLLVGAYANDFAGANAGRAYLFFGGPAADATADLTLTGATANDQFGWTVASAGDVNGDGLADLLVGAYDNDAGGTDAGRAYVYFGGAIPNAIADITFTGATAGDQFGLSVAAAGDVDGDGFDDLIVGSNGQDAGGLDAGRAYVIAVYPYQVLSPNGGEQWVAGQPAEVRWRGHDVADLAISFDGGASWSTLLANVGGQEENEIHVIAPGPASDLARIRLSYAGQTVTRTTSDLSDGVFRIVLPAPRPAAAHRLQLSPTGAGAGDNLGISVASGDFNGDGFTDLIVGAHRNDAGGADAGRAYVYHGGPAADATPDLTLTGSAAGDEFGVSVAAAGDVNGDGFADLIVGAWLNDAGGADAGRAYVFHGGPGADATPDLTLTGAAAGDRFGVSVATAGDVNGDGFADLIVGADFNDAGGSNGGRAYVYHGGIAADATADLTLTGTAANDQFGHSAAGAGDVNGDGFADLIVGAFRNDVGGTDAGRAYVYHGGPTADATSDLTLTGAAAGDFFGYSVAAAGDVNGDGFADVIVGGYTNDMGGLDAGRAYVHHGGPGADAIADLTLTGAAAGDFFGYSVAAAGDVNGDGFADVIVGAWFNDAGGSDAGRAYVYHGGPATDATADVTLTGDASGDAFGSSVAAAGDVNGDGFADVIAGANANDVGGAQAGRIYLFDCNRYFLLAPNDDEVWNVGAGQSVTWLGAERADLWLSVDAGRTYDLLRHDVGGAESNAVSLLVPHAPTKFARVKVTPADPAVRGLDESDSTFTIQSSIALLSLAASLTERGAELSWSTNPSVGPLGLAGYRLYRVAAGASGNGTRIGPELITEPYHIDRDGAPGHVYRLVAVNGLREELELGRVGLAPAAPLAAWPLPYRGGALTVSFGVHGLFGADAGEAVVGLYDLGGRLVKTLARGRFEAGYRTVLWDGRDVRGARVGGGIYFLRAVSAGVSHRLKVVVLP